MFLHLTSPCIKVTPRRERICSLPGGNPISAANWIPSADAVFFRNPMVHHHHPKSPPSGIIKRQLNLVHIYTAVILSHLCLGLPGKRFFQPRFCITGNLLLFMRTTYPTHFFSFGFSNNIWWGVQVMKLLVM